MNTLAMIELGPLWLSLKLAAVTVVILLLLSTPLAWWLAHTRWRGRALVEALVALPLVLPPTVLGFYLLLLMGPEGALGGLWLRVADAPLTFSFTGLVLASVLYSLPFVVQPLQQAFAGQGRLLMEAAACLRATPWDAFRTVALPLAWRGYVAAMVLGFAHTLGEFGVVLMVGGNIPGETRVLSIALYDHVERLDYAQAHLWSALLVGLSFITLAALYATQGMTPWGRRMP